MTPLNKLRATGAEEATALGASFVGSEHLFLAWLVIAEGPAREASSPSSFATELDVPKDANGRRANAGPFAVFIGVEPTAKVANPREPTVDAFGPPGPAREMRGPKPSHSDTPSLIGVTTNGVVAPLRTTTAADRDVQQSWRVEGAGLGRASCGLVAITEPEDATKDPKAGPPSLNPRREALASPTHLREYRSVPGRCL